MTPTVAQALPSLAKTDVKGYELTKHGIVFHRSLSDVEYESLGRRLAVVANASPWQLGDWLVAGTGRYEEAGSTYEQVQALTGRSFETVATWLRVALSYEHQVRGLVAWTFYREALRLPGKDRIPTLTIAANNGWSRADLVGFIGRRLFGDELETIANDGRRPPVVGSRRPGRRHGAQHVRCPHCRTMFPVRGNTVATPAKGEH